MANETGAKIIKLGIHLAEHHSEGTVSQIFDLGPSFYFMESRKLSFEKGKKFPVFFT